uniref:alpha-1,2-Mannosidase n=1 Tax=Arcella intermedia TaxID=1963864 RepID=A0A6B2L338_9EUKA
MIKGMGLSLIDSLDTMLIMNLTNYYKHARDYLAETLSWDRDIIVSVFETNIRCVGGLLAAYDMTQDEFFLKSAVDLGDRLLNAFQTPTGLPRTTVNLKTGAATNPSWTQQSSLLAEIGTLQIEFSYLSYASKQPRFAQKAMAVYDHLLTLMPEDKLLPIFINPDDGKPKGTDLVSVGALGDSYFEYLFKYWLITKKASRWGKEYFETVESILNTLAFKIVDQDEEMWYIAERQNKNINHKFDHLACFFGGLLALDAQHAPTEQMRERHMEIGKGIGAFCRKMYTMNPTRLPCDFVNIVGNTISNPIAAGKGWLMRPEAVETWFILYRLTNDTKYQEWGWDYFEAIEKYTKKEYGYTGLRDVTDSQKLEPDDVQQSYFLAETLKYLFLLFSPKDTIPLDKFVFNTEAHPLSFFEAQ